MLTFNFPWITSSIWMSVGCLSSFYMQVDTVKIVISASVPLPTSFKKKTLFLILYDFLSFPFSHGRITALVLTPIVGSTTGLTCDECFHAFLRNSIQAQRARHLRKYCVLSLSHVRRWQPNFGNEKCVLCITTPIYLHQETFYDYNSLLIHKL